jgi:threonine dehydrogenase-like Zn-dependent dehydrogenase
MLGLTAAAACAAAGARVRVSDIERSRLDLVDGFGGTPDSGGPVDTAIDFSGSSAAISGALGRLDVGGAMVLAGSVMPGPAVPMNPESVVRQWLTVTGVHNYEPRHLAQAVEFLGETRDVYPWAALVSEPVQLDDLASAFEPAPPGKLRASVAP